MDKKIIFLEKIHIQTTYYTLVKIQRGGRTAIYTNGTTYLRLGPRVLIQKNLILHESMIRAGFPVPQIISTGTHQGMDYFIESSLGSQSLAALLNNEISTTGCISNDSFNKFISITQQLMVAQFATAQKFPARDTFSKNIQLETLCTELPQYADTIRTLFGACMQRLSVFPGVLTHGDFNPHNTFPQGIIDFTDSFQGFFGYDLLGAIVHNDYFPQGAPYEYFQEYAFSDVQKNTYLNCVDNFFVSHGLPQVSLFIKDIEFCKAVWLLVGIHKWPKLQQHRYHLFIERFLQ